MGIGRVTSRAMSVGQAGDRRKYVVTPSSKSRRRRQTDLISGRTDEAPRRITATKRPGYPHAIDAQMAPTARAGRGLDPPRPALRGGAVRRADRGPAWHRCSRGVTCAPSRQSRQRRRASSPDLSTGDTCPSPVESDHLVKRTIRTIVRKPAGVVRARICRKRSGRVAWQTFDWFRLRSI